MADEMTELSQLSMTVTSRGRFTLAKLSGAVDESAMPMLEDLALQVRSQAAKTVALDLSEVPGVDSEGLGWMIHLQRQLIDTGRHLVLIGSRGPVREALTLTRLEVLLPCFESVDQIPY